MDDMIDIEFRSKLGEWKRYSTVPNTPSHIKRGLQAASKHRLVADPKRLRAVDQKSKQIVELEQ